MKKSYQKINKLFSILLTVLMLLSSILTGMPNIEAAGETFTVKFVNADGSTISERVVPAGTTWDPTWIPPDPTLTIEDFPPFTFQHWSESPPVRVVRNYTFKAVYTAGGATPPPSRGWWWSKHTKTWFDSFFKRISVD